MAGKKKEASLQVGRAQLETRGRALPVLSHWWSKHTRVLGYFLVQVSVTNQEQWEEMLATKGLTGGS